jgi:hypothetical protein
VRDDIMLEEEDIRDGNSHDKEEDEQDELDI